MKKCLVIEVTKKKGNRRNRDGRWTDATHVEFGFGMPTSHSPATKLNFWSKTERFTKEQTARRLEPFTGVMRSDRWHTHWESRTTQSQSVGEGNTRIYIIVEHDKRNYKDSLKVCCGVWRILSASRSSSCCCSLSLVAKNKGTLCKLCKKRMKDGCQKGHCARWDTMLFKPSKKGSNNMNFGLTCLYLSPIYKSWRNF